MLLNVHTATSTYTRDYATLPKLSSTDSSMRATNMNRALVAVTNGITKANVSRYTSSCSVTDGESDAASEVDRQQLEVVTKQHSGGDLATSRGVSSEVLEELVCVLVKLASGVHDEGNEDDVAVFAVLLVLGVLVSGGLISFEIHICYDWYSIARLHRCCEVSFLDSDEGSHDGQVQRIR